jgi:hypothetical protein
MEKRAVRFLFVLVLFAGSAWAAGAEVEKLDASALPAELSDALKSLLSNEGLAVSLDGEEVARVWLCSELVAAENASSELGVEFGQIEPGSLVGIVQFLKQWSDYKLNPIAEGLYPMRYWPMPADGNHMGVATYRDFLLLTSLTADTDLEANLDLAGVLVASSDATGVPHPGVLALFPIWDEIDEPKMVKNDVDQWTLAVKVGDQTLGLVMAGHGEIH